MREVRSADVVVVEGRSSVLDDDEMEVCMSEVLDNRSERKDFDPSWVNARLVGVEEKPVTCTVVVDMTAETDLTALAGCAIGVRKHIL